MTAHSSALAAWFKQDLVGDAHLAHIMQESATPDVHDFKLTYA